MNPKTYTKNGIDYGYSVKAKKWFFRSEAAKYEFLTLLGADKTVCHKIASALAGALKRTKNAGLDGMGRGQIEKLVSN